MIESSFVAQVEHHPSISSTNDRAIAAASELGVRLPLLIVADKQTAGRGRGSNRWWTGPGGLAFSILLKSADTARPSGLIALAAGVAVVDALAPLAPGHEIGICWPNDVMLDGRKLAGILIEVLADGRQVIGIGVNTNNTSADAPATSVRGWQPFATPLGGRMIRPSYSTLILARLEDRLAELARSPDKIAAQRTSFASSAARRCWFARASKQSKAYATESRRMGACARSRPSKTGDILRHRRRGRLPGGMLGVHDRLRSS